MATDQQPSADDIALVAEVEKWWDHLHAAHEAGTFLAGFTAFIVAGAKGGAAS